MDRQTYLKSRAKARQQAIKKKPIKKKYVIVKGKAYEIATPDIEKKTIKKVEKPKKLSDIERAKRDVVGFFQNGARVSLFKDK